MAGNLKNKVTGFVSLLLLLFIATSASHCNEDKDLEYVFMSFIIPLQITPQAIQINLGDTLWLSGSFDDNLLEYHTNKYYKFPNFDFKSMLCLAYLTTNQRYYHEQPGLNKFSFINVEGQLKNLGSLCGDISFFYKSGRYQYKIGLIPNTKGVFSVGFLMPVDLHGIPEEQVDLIGVIDLGVSPSGVKRIPVYEAFLFLINNGETHFDLFKEYCRAGSVENPNDVKNVWAEQKGTFTFRVVE